MSETNGCYYYDEQHNRCKCYVNENLDELLQENARLRELVRDAYLNLLNRESLLDLIGMPMSDEQVYATEDIADRMRELGIEVG